MSHNNKSYTRWLNLPKSETQHLYDLLFGVIIQTLTLTVILILAVRLTLTLILAVRLTLTLTLTNERNSGNNRQPRHPWNDIRKYKQEERAQQSSTLNFQPIVSPLNK